MSRQFNVEKALVLFGDRVAEAELQVVAAPRPLIVGPGLQAVERAANRAGIAII